MNALKSLLRDTDYKAIKAAEGSPSADWPEARAKREAWRTAINALQAEIDALPDGGGSI